jgi:hypothetical protein
MNHHRAPSLFGSQNRGPDVVRIGIDQRLFTEQVDDAGSRANQSAPHPWLRMKKTYLPSPPAMCKRA